jgi:hypothetical protein
MAVMVNAGVAACAGTAVQATTINPQKIVSQLVRMAVSLGKRGNSCLVFRNRRWNLFSGSGLVW